MIVDLAVATRTTFHTIRNIVQSYQPLHDEGNGVETSLVAAPTYDPQPIAATLKVQEGSETMGDHLGAIEQEWNIEQAHWC